VAILNLMEDAATVEIARSQIWQWIHYDVSLPDGRTITTDLVRVALADAFAEFLTVVAYPLID
jgi:malate synthase